MMMFLLKLLTVIGVAALCGTLCALCGMAVGAAKDALVDSGIIKDKDAIDDAYRRGLWLGQAQANKYPMGQYTFPIACSHCENLNSDKCYRCKEEIESGFKLKMEAKDDDTV